MKTVEVHIKGNSLLAYVTFYDEDILSKLNEIDEGEYDFIDFCSEHEKGGAFLGRGFCEDGNLNLKVSVDSTEVFDDGLYFIDDGRGTDSLAQLQERFQDVYGDDENYEKCLVARSSESLEADSHFFADADKYKYCSLETVQCYKSPYTIKIEAEDDFKLSDLSLVVVDVDSGDTGSITDKLYACTGLEKQVLGIKYRGEFFEFHGGEDEGGSNQIHWYERNGDKWTGSEAIEERIDELEAW